MESEAIQKIERLQRYFEQLKTVRPSDEVAWTVDEAVEMGVDLLKFGTLLLKPACTETQFIEYMRATYQDCPTARFRFTESS